MKKTTTMIVALMLGIGAVVQADDNEQAKRVGSLYQQGVIAMKEGKYSIAKMSFEAVLRINPKHLPARKNLHFISSNRNSLDIKNRKIALRRIIIPKVNLEKATMREALDILALQIERESKQKVTPNFILQDSTGAFNNSRITLRLNNIPAETLLGYIVGQGGGLIRYDNHAIVISPRRKVPSKPATPKKEEASGFSD